ncbi:MAG: hypothetical protein JRI97_07105 [Deltaproteobacteria bacterium]|nr:hypothetical protein [Deltaproteobacteria bacterium]
MKRIIFNTFGALFALGLVFYLGFPGEENPAGPLTQKQAREAFSILQDGIDQWWAEVSAQNGDRPVPEPLAALHRKLMDQQDKVRTGLSRMDETGRGAAEVERALAELDRSYREALKWSR